MKSVFIKDLKKGDIVSYYGAKFEITEDAKMGNHAPVAPCKRIDEPHNPYLDDILNSYDYFQGLDKVAVIN